MFITGCGSSSNESENNGDTTSNNNSSGEDIVRVEDVSNVPNIEHTCSSFFLNSRGQTEY